MEDQKCFSLSRLLVKEFHLSQLFCGQLIISFQMARFHLHAFVPWLVFIYLVGIFYWIVLTGIICFFSNFFLLSCLVLLCFSLSCLMWAWTGGVQIFEVNECAGFFVPSCLTKRISTKFCFYLYTDFLLLKVDLVLCRPLRKEAVLLTSCWISVRKHSLSVELVGRYRPIMVHFSVEPKGH